VDHLGTSTGKPRGVAGLHDACPLSVRIVGPQFGSNS